MIYIKHALLLTLCCFTLAFQDAKASEIHKDINYIDGGTLHAQALDIYAPTSTTSANKYPVHIFVHGGGWVTGDKKAVTARIAKKYTDQKIIMVSVNYRLGPDHKFPANIEDLAAASAWLYKHIDEYGGDANNMVISGHSAGAHLVALLATAPKYLAKYDLKPNTFKSIYVVDTASLNLTTPTTGKAARMVNFMKRRAFGTDPKIRVEASPLLQVKANQPYSPIHSYVTAQRPDAVAETQEFTDKLKSFGYESDITVMADTYSHSDMKDDIFKTESPIYKHIVDTLK